MYTAKIKNGIVVQVIVGDEALAKESLGGDWVNSPNKIGINWTYDENGFRQPRPYPSWFWADGWKPPVPYPDGDAEYEWDEETVSWATIDPIGGQE